MVGADPGFQVRRGALKFFLGVFRVKNHDFTQTNHMFSNFRGGGAGCAPESLSHRRYILIFFQNWGYFQLGLVYLENIIMQNSFRLL